MDGNGRWAKQRGKPRFWGHQAGVEAVRRVVDAAVKHHVSALSLFAFSSENWQRPQEEVSFLMQLFITVLKREIKQLHKNNVKLTIIGDISRFAKKLQTLILESQALTVNNSGLNLCVAANYGGRWDITHACQKLAEQVAKGELKPADITQDRFQSALSISNLPEPDLLIRTSGELRISNFYLWQMAYTEFYFTKVMWPDFDEACLLAAIEEYAKRQRRYGAATEQMSN